MPPTYTERHAPADDPSVIELADVRPEALVAWRKACAHLRAHGVPPLPPPHVIRALRARGWWPR